MSINVHQYLNVLRTAISYLLLLCAKHRAVVAYFILQQPFLRNIYYPHFTSKQR